MDVNWAVIQLPLLHRNETVLFKTRNCSSWEIHLFDVGCLYNSKLSHSSQSNTCGRVSTFLLPVIIHSTHRATSLETCVLICSMLKLNLHDTWRLLSGWTTCQLIILQPTCWGVCWESVTVWLVVTVLVGTWMHHQFAVAWMTFQLPE